MEDNKKHLGIHDQLNVIFRKMVVDNQWEYTEEFFNDWVSLISHIDFEIAEVTSAKSFKARIKSKVNDDTVNDNHEKEITTDESQK